MKILLTTVLLITILGALNWALDSIGYNLVTLVTNSKTTQKIIYYIISLCALITLMLFIKDKIYQDD
jgi:uncharacterized membrane protein YuzA (DUF378 family)